MLVIGSSATKSNLKLPSLAGCYGGVGGEAKVLAARHGPSTAYLILHPEQLNGTWAQVPPWTWKSFGEGISPSSSSTTPCLTCKGCSAAARLDRLLSHVSTIRSRVARQGAMRNLQNVRFGRWRHSDITATCWDPESDEILCTVGPSPSSSNTELMRVSGDVDTFVLSSIPSLLVVLTNVGTVLIVWLRAGIPRALTQTCPRTES